ncbi:substrate-binding domain-containing protein, partial [Bacillus sp. GbtcB15]
GESKGFIGISMPTKSSERWVKDGENMKKMFEELGYQTDLQYAEDIIENQTAQIENMITKGVDVLVIAPIDDRSGLSSVLERANKRGIKVISY